MNIPLLVGSIILVLLLALWCFYNFYWLNQPQTYLVYGNVNVPFDYTQGKSIADHLNGQLATADQLVDSLAAGASNCTYGFVNCAGCTGACKVYCNGTSTSAILLPLNVEGASGMVTNCGMNNQINTNYVSNAAGYWIYGPKPKSADAFSGWTIAPFHAPIGNDTRNTFNRFEILGIPKLI
jgi:hypothetical protein